MGRLAGLGESLGGDPAFAYESGRDAWLSGTLAGWTIEDDLCLIPANLLLIQGQEGEFGTLRHPEAIKASVEHPVPELVIPGWAILRIVRRAALCRVRSSRF